MKSIHERFYFMMHRFRKMHMDHDIEGISKMEFALIESIRRTDFEKEISNGICVSELASLMQVAPPAISRLLKGLEEREMIVREIDKKNRRNTYVKLTSEGMEICDKIEQQMTRHMERIFDRMGEEKMEQIIELCLELQDCMLEEMKTEK